MSRKQRLGMIVGFVALVLVVVLVNWIQGALSSYRDYAQPYEAFDDATSNISIPASSMWVGHITLTLVPVDRDKTGAGEVEIYGPASGAVVVDSWVDDAIGPFPIASGPPTQMSTIRTGAVVCAAGNTCIRHYTLTLVNRADQASGVQVHAIGWLGSGAGATRSTSSVTIELSP